MASHRWSLLCQSTAQSPTGNVSINEIIDEFQVGGLPPEVVQSFERDVVVNVVVNFQIVSAWRRDDPRRPERLEMRVVFVDPRGREIANTQAQPVSLAEHVTMRMIAAVATWPLRGFGFYGIRVERRANATVTWELVDTVPVLVAEGPAPSVRPGAE